MGLAGKLAKKGAKAAGRGIAKKVNGGCPGSSNGRHSYKVKMIGAVKANKKKGIKGSPGSPVTYCHNAGCGRVS